MSPVWSRVWNTSCGASGSCAAECFNPLFPSQGVSGNVLDNFPLYIQTCGQAMGEFGNALKASIPANSVVTATTNNGTTFSLAIQIDPRTTAAAVISFLNLRGDFPITCTYTKGDRTGTSSFLELSQALAWLVKNLR